MVTCFSLGLQQNTHHTGGTKTYQDRQGLSIVQGWEMNHQSADVADAKRLVQRGWFVFCLFLIYVNSSFCSFAFQFWETDFVAISKAEFASPSLKYILHFFLHLCNIHDQVCHRHRKILFRKYQSFHIHFSKRLAWTHRFS